MIFAPAAQSLFNNYLDENIYEDLIRNNSNNGLSDLTRDRRNLTKEPSRYFTFEYKKVIYDFYFRHHHFNLGDYTEIIKDYMSLYNKMDSIQKLKRNWMLFEICRTFYKNSKICQ